MMTTDKNKTAAQEKPSSSWFGGLRDIFPMGQHGNDTVKHTELCSQQYPYRTFDTAFHRVLAYEVFFVLFSFVFLCGPMT